ncbi:twin-arginine translocase subunit TatC [Halegenticoccus soli]|uniref:twin-arginine translocase subunit TatC n=1 Tax=Halegenticoccus soli TaxID=1985678 RepID=UPI000C6E2B63|nr:twin-arginine translocase subunit TatC [Halegenticoccus soli]
MREPLTDDARRALDGGRETVGAMLRAARDDLRKVFAVFLLGFLGTFYSLRLHGWEFLKRVTTAGMSEWVGSNVEFIALTPFDVILLQAKFATFGGALLALPVFVYFARAALDARGLWPRSIVARRTLVPLAFASAALFALGVIYSYRFFIPLLFEFLAGNALSAGFEPQYSIVQWAQFVLLLTVTFGAAAQLPLVMTALSHADVVPYATFRRRWRHAVVAIVVVSSMANGSPDPFSMSLVALPLVALYAVGLGCSKVATAAARNRGRFDHRTALGAAPTPATAGDPQGIDIASLDAAGVRAAPPEAFDALTEAAALSHADAALGAGDHAKARAVLDRFDEAQLRREVRERKTPANSGADDGTAADPTAGDSDAERSFLDSLADERDPDDVGGYYVDIKFVLDSITSRSFRVVGAFMLIMGGTFTWLYSGGIGGVKRDFLGRLPPSVHPESLTIVTLHPVEALVFEMKFSLLVALVATLPVVAYYAWPALRDRGFVRGHQRIIFGWTAALVAGLAGGFALGYAYVAPTVVSYLVADAIRADMIISYRISDFFWLIFYTTAGIGLLADVPVLMILLNTAGVPYRTMRDRWREVAVALLLLAAYFTPGGAVTMFLVTIPLMVAYGVGLVALFVFTVGGRRDLVAFGISKG